MTRAKWNIVARIAVAAFLTACPARSWAQAPSAPDSTRLSLLRFMLLNFDDVRVASGGRKLVTRSPLVSSDGLMLTRGDGSRITAAGGSGARMIPWSEVESIEVRRGGDGAPVLLGALAGGAIGLAIVAAQALPLAFAGKEADGRPILFGLVGGAALGALLGSPGRWRPVYPSE